MQLTKTQNTQI